jgi:hypothetical protein
MSGWADLVLRGQPRLLDHEMKVTEGADWGFVLEGFVDGAGNAVDLSTATFECKALTDLLDATPAGSVVATWTVTGDAAGALTGVLDDATTAGKGTGATKHRGRQLIWYCFGTLSGAKVQFWGPSGSPFVVEGS